ncbi:hypothetical protein [Cohnella sp. AR92]|uniref:hypothetical protein n=1 Tax=Cohnella sp. AR92 TaxID=648716 RepID=UPI000F8DEA97|nr:hypothetical protein [Cohnella sp. AR92]RUS46966.1 hypothetical protein ELR57_11200 [Cohnella sp. AR92]
MSQRYRITRSFQENNPEQTISLEECLQYFDSKPDFKYAPVYTVTGPESTMSIEGNFFLWHHDGKIYPFRHYDGDLYVAVSIEAIVPLMMEIASELKADISEG